MKFGSFEYLEWAKPAPLGRPAVRPYSDAASARPAFPPRHRMGFGAAPEILGRGWMALGEL
jgi:hypothetical protein